MVVVRVAVNHGNRLRWFKRKSLTVQKRLHMSPRDSFVVDSQGNLEEDEVLTPLRGTVIDDTLEHIVASAHEDWAGGARRDLLPAANDLLTMPTAELV
eukprot:1182387-Prorocentrum_minimum.AAC.2